MRGEFGEDCKAEGQVEYGQIRRPSLTEARREQLSVEIGKKLLAVCVELAHSGDNIARRAHTDDLHDGLEDEEGQIGKVGMRGMGILERGEHGAGDGVLGLGGEGDKGRGGGEGAQAQGHGRGEEGHGEASVGCRGSNQWHGGGNGPGIS